MSKVNVTLEGKKYQIDIEKAKKLGVLEEKDTRCKSWDDFLEKYAYRTGFYFDEAKGNIDTTVNPIAFDEQLTEEETNAMVAFSKLLKLRRDWIGTWKPNWFESVICIEVCNDFEEFEVNRIYKYPRAFSFPTEEMAREFLECFRNLFEQCKCLI